MKALSMMYDTNRDFTLLYRLANNYDCDIVFVCLFAVVKPDGQFFTSPYLSSPAKQGK